MTTSLDVEVLDFSYLEREGYIPYITEPAGEEVGILGHVLAHARIDP